MTSAYSTRIPRQYTERFGCEELHGALNAGPIVAAMPRP
jgi:hypothetical protein